MLGDLINVTRSVATLQGELSKVRGQFAASKQEGLDSELQGDLLAARQKLSEDMQRLLCQLQASAGGYDSGGNSRG